MEGRDLLLLVGVAAGVLYLRRRGLLGGNGDYDEQTYEYWDKPKLEAAERFLGSARATYNQQGFQEQQLRRRVIDVYNRYRPTPVPTHETLEQRRVMNDLMGRIQQSEYDREMLRRRIQKTQDEFKKHGTAVLNKAKSAGLIAQALEVQRKLESLSGLKRPAIAAE